MVTAHHPPFQRPPCIYLLNRRAGLGRAFLPLTPASSRSERPILLPSICRLLLALQRQETLHPEDKVS